MELELYNISPSVTAFSTKRQGGYSSGPYGSFNVNSYCGDNITNVEKNIKLLSDYLHISPDHLIIPHQIHKTKTLKVDESFIKSNRVKRAELLEGADALITNIPGYCISVSTADCIPILIYDPTNHAIASIHAGWRGTLSSICIHTIKEMSTHYGTKTDDCIAVIGPGISLKNFEVGDEVYTSFLEKGFPMEKISCRHDKWHIDLTECNRLQLFKMGINNSNIHILGKCTYDNYETFFSARRLGVNSGRILTGILLKQS